MPTYLNQGFGWTIAPGASLRYWYSWENIPGTGPNHGPVIFCANPKPRQGAEVKLVTFDNTKCRRANGPVFYEFSVRSESASDAIFDLEIVWGTHNDSPGSPSVPW